MIQLKGHWRIRARKNYTLLLLMKLQNSTVGESLCHGAEAISRKVATALALRASEITHYSLGTMIVVKRVTTICQECVFFPPGPMGSLSFAHPRI